MIKYIVILQFARFFTSAGQDGKVLRSDFVREMMLPGMDVHICIVQWIHGYLNPDVSQAMVKVFI